MQSSCFSTLVRFMLTQEKFWPLKNYKSSWRGGQLCKKYRSETISSTCPAAASGLSVRQPQLRCLGLVSWVEGGSGCGRLSGAPLLRRLAERPAARGRGLPRPDGLQDAADSRTAAIASHFLFLPPQRLVPLLSGLRLGLRSYDGVGRGRRRRRWHPAGLTPGRSSQESSVGFTVPSSWFYCCFHPSDDPLPTPGSCPPLRRPPLSSRPPRPPLPCVRRPFCA